MRSLVVATALGLVLAGCAQAAPSSPPSVPAVTPAPTPSPSPTVAPSPTLAETPSPDPTDPPEPDPSAFLQVCESWGAAGNPIPCSDAIETALASLADFAGVVRIDMSFACVAGTGCPRAEGRAWVVITQGTSAVEVEVVRGDDGGLSTGAPAPVALPVPVSFTPPAPGRPVIEGAPSSVATRETYPLCGDETAGMGGPYDEAARTCFLDGVLAGSPVEFVSRSSGTEGDSLVQIYRFSGTGGVEQITADSGQWTSLVGGISTAGGGLVFDLDGMTTKHRPLP